MKREPEVRPREVRHCECQKQNSLQRKRPDEGAKTSQPEFPVIAVLA